MRRSSFDPFPYLLILILVFAWLLPMKTRIKELENRPPAVAICLEAIMEGPELAPRPLGPFPQIDAAHTRLGVE